MEQNNNSRRIFIFSLAAALLIAAVLVIQYKIIEVSAITVILPVAVVQHDSLDFGTVFPGEDHEGTFTIQYVQETEDLTTVNYQVILQRKPLPPDYPEEGDPEKPGYYKDLCGSLTAVSVEEEGNTGSVGIDDGEDIWTIYFKVPAILGNVAQSHEGEIVTSSGDYGCDVSINVIEQ